ncbi:pyridine nucleotide-disulfide oxidoreductase [Klebsiella pneumoniae subsp. pneumoniae]|nr:pyridine nucleotide-disulfide oxidoreductase [Klebsiella pneumoniae subsp. pneumoniae]
MNGARLIARPSAHSVLFETADGGGVVYWQKLILCCSAGGLQAVADTMNQAGGDVTNIIEQALLPALAALRDAINRTFRLAESLKNAATPESLLCRCEDVRCGDVAAADDWLQAKLTQRPLAVWLAAAAAERAAVPRPRGNAYCPRQAERRAVTATLLHRRARQGRQAQ